ncbi:efflux RND transporter periplasmic adaptor subunit [Sneathiella sp.]|uniref:efflux RND transporter periplasmic adaptor subunit n=1 Tax=Sneathiella sp. TaxID=1964365 RepID=UPI0026382088|nr:efflux RND transporter periplasmic adaptor subunit [Sneathiella sp.]MDF2366050.1 efflux RND transporter periplasmic adaptor subunit [Sneathiella sp.]
MRTRLFRYLLLLLAIGAVAAAVFLFIFMRPLPVEIAHPAENVPIQVFGLGTVEARILSKVGFEVGAALVELNADQGDWVKEGDILARLHSAEQEARVAKAKAGIANAEAAVKTAEAAVGKARAVLAQKKQSNKRKQALVAKQTVSAESAEEAQMEEDVAAAELAVAISDVEVAKAALEDALAQFGVEKVLLGHHVLRAPYDAIVVQRHKELGSVLSSGDVLFTLVAPETVWALAYVDEAGAGDLRVNQPAEVRLRSLPRQMFEGHVTRIDIESDRVSEERRVYIACDLCPESFHLGEQAEIFITTGILDKALLMPEAAVEHFDGTKGTVWTVEDGELHRRDVVFGQRTLDSRLEITDGLPEGARVVSALRPGLREGRAAKVLEEITP